MIQTTAGGRESWVSAADMVSLLVLNLILFGELIVLTLSTWLLFRSMIASAAFPYAGNEKEYHSRFVRSMSHRHADRPSIGRISEEPWGLFWAYYLLASARWHGVPAK